MKKFLIGAILALVSTSVFAHTGHSSHGFLAGFTHPFTGADHLLVMLAIGLWAGKLGGAARWQLPLTFVSIMAMSAIYGMVGISSAMLEFSLVVSVMAVGLLLAISLPINRVLQLGLTVVFAMLHGLSHGAELVINNGMSVIFGLVLATALLHSMGLIISNQYQKINHGTYSVFGYLIFLTGGYMLLALP